MEYPLLESIHSPADIKGWNDEKLNQLSAEIRQRIIDVMSVNGGHLASNLGTIELTIALHKVFDSPDDKLIWDVSHQTYSHKLLTGRNPRFHTIRQHKGLCGFSHPKESSYDHFYAGHAGTALSLALGLVKNRDLAKRHEYIIPIIGDATLTCGMSLEALNNLSREIKRFIVILNDNAMSISQNVGAITRILSRILSNPTTHKLHQEIDMLVSKIPSLGAMLSKQGHKITESLKNLVSPAAFFQQYGLSYIGPVDGHNIAKMVELFEELKDSNWPIVVHVQTNKGQGMEQAIRNPVSYHGVKPFNKDTGKFLPTPSSKPTFPKIFGSHILKMAENDPSLVAVTPAMSAGSCLDEFMAKFPDRCLDVGIAEGHCVTFSGGLAYGRKMKVICSIYSTFLQRALDNLFHDVCLQELPVVFAIDRAGIAGPDGSTHNGIYDISFLNAMPNMIIAQPRNGQLLKELMESAFAWGRPAAIRYPNLATEDSTGPLTYRELGKGEVLAQGQDILLIGLGHMAYTALQVREKLSELGINATVLDPVFVKPLDTELLFSLLDTHQRIVTIEEHSAVCGLGAIVNHFLMTQGYSQLQVINIGVPEAFIEHGSHAQLSQELGLSPDKIAQRVTQQFSLAERIKA
ncbi:MAG: 1-deoxy-D-xylulose-5-phosphate synthase [Parachlamydia sp.]|nr:1-deoxy-D-xylulose-5-phosphate synthase [Parachlamydia sp.]